MNSELREGGKSSAFVDFIIGRIGQDKGVAAALRRADNPATEYQSWEQLAAFHINLEKAYERLPYATIAAAISKAKADRNGPIGLGKAIARCYSDGNKSDQAKAKLRRLLACDSVEEVCRILRPLFSLINSKGNSSLNFAGILNDLQYFHWNSQAVKSRWAQDFYRYVPEEGE